ncbi:TPA: hypothetical protein DDZ86_05015 [Candidatus Dependentiae bacterium]|nr:MAG: hypothetical protein A2Y17_09820 [Clostridiales bacterium GWF2_38_85]HBL98972.1 hypothetical protein [Candidatus Dependentiae bacterium]
MKKQLSLIGFSLTILLAASSKAMNQNANSSTTPPPAAQLSSPPPLNRQVRFSLNLSERTNRINLNGNDPIDDNLPTESSSSSSVPRSGNRPTSKPTTRILFKSRQHDLTCLKDSLRKLKYRLIKKVEQLESKDEENCTHDTEAISANYTKINEALQTIEKKFALQLWTKIKPFFQYDSIKDEFKINCLLKTEKLKRVATPVDFKRLTSNLLKIAHLKQVKSAQITSVLYNTDKKLHHYR